MKQIFKKIVVTLLTLEAKLVLKKYKPKIAGVTGSVGKTSTKDALYTVLSPFYFVRKSHKSFNSEIGVPLTILGLPNAWNNPIGWLKNLLEGFLLIVFPHKYPEWLVLEIGADRPGDIAKTVEWVKPDIAVVTRLGKVPVHVEFFASPEGLFNEKRALVTALKPGGILVLNHDDEDVRAFSSYFDGNIIFYGLEPDADIFGTYYEIDYGDIYEERKPIGFSYKADYKGEVAGVTIRKCIGRQYMYSSLAALAAGCALGLPLAKMAESFKQYEPTQGRMRIISGIKNTQIIDDTYNSSPVALTAALSTLGSMETARKRIAVLGDMLELGVHTSDAHKQAGSEAAAVCDMLVTVGVRAHMIAEGALAAGMDESKILQYEDSRRAGKELEGYLERGDIILVKGSQGVRMERVVEEIMQHPENKEVLLVRQDEEWKNR